VKAFTGGGVRPKSARSFAASVLLAAAALASGCASGPKATEISAATEAYRLGPSDQLSIRVLPEPAIALDEVLVRPDGKISIELIGDVHAAGRTTDEVATEIAEKMTEFRQSPSVSVSVVTPASTTVSVLGEVKAPGSFALDRDIRLSEAIALAGGNTELGATSRVRLVRRDGSGTTLYLANLDRIRAGDGSTDVLLRRGDLVVVPAAYPVVAGYEIRKALYPLEVLFRTVGSSFFLLTAFN
jgi:polysaccharide export outer membrane protein